MPTVGRALIFVLQLAVTCCPMLGCPARLGFCCALRWAGSLTWMGSRLGLAGPTWSENGLEGPACVRVRWTQVSSFTDRREVNLAASGFGLAWLFCCLAGNIGMRQKSCKVCARTWPCSRIEPWTPYRCNTRLSSSMVVLFLGGDPAPWVNGLDRAGCPSVPMPLRGTGVHALDQGNVPVSGRGCLHAACGAGGAGTGHARYCSDQHQHAYVRTAQKMLGGNTSTRPVAKQTSPVSPDVCSMCVCGLPNSSSAMYVMLLCHGVLKGGRGNYQGTRS